MKNVLFHTHIGIVAYSFESTININDGILRFTKKMTEKFPFLTEIYTILIPVKNKGFNFTMGDFNDFHFHLLMFELYKGKEDRLDLNSNFQFSIQPHFQCKNLQWKSLPCEKCITYIIKYKSVVGKSSLVEFMPTSRSSI